MFAPKLYTVYKIPLRDIMAADFDICLPVADLARYKIRQQDSAMLRQIRLITGEDKQFNPYIIFVDIDKKDEDAIRRIVMGGFVLNGAQFIMSERSASMTRTGILSFVDADIEPELNRRITMDIEFEKIVISKYAGYRGLALSACHNLEGFRPKIIIVPDYYRIIPKQKIKYAYDDTTEFIDKEGRDRTWTQKNICEGVQDIEINAFDGCGVIHPALCREIEERLGSKTSITSFIARAPYFKGCLFSCDYEAFYAQRGITQIQDIWGVWHDFSEPMILALESMYKGFKYFKKYGDERDWQHYWDMFEKYDHCIGIAKWNFTADEEPVYTRGNYQILQDLDLPYEEFRNIANYSVDWVEKIIQGDLLYTYCFLGMTAESQDAKNDYVAAILKNPEMIKEPSVKKYLLNLLSKYRDDMKCGKLWIKATFKFVAPDLIMLMEHIAGLEPVGCLEADEFYSHDKNGVILGERLIERNPHICRSEHTVLRGVQNELTNTFLSHLDNVCMINSKSITPQRLNGCDFDGDIVLVVDNDIMMRGVDRNIPVVLDIEDKVTVEPEPYTPENKVALVLRTINSLIGETSNCATGYHNKKPKSEEIKKKYESYIDLLSVINGKNIDFAKTGVMYNIPKHIAKYSKPLPYFMKYASEYYGGLNTFSEAPSNMNRLCKDLERWCKAHRYAADLRGFDYTIMIDESIPEDPELQQQINKIYLEFCNEMASLLRDQNNVRKYGDESLSTYDSRNFTINWGYYYDIYRQRCRELCPDQKQLANMAVRACYEYHANKKNTKFMWRVASEGILQNIKQVNFPLPSRDDNGEYEYLGRRYTFKYIQGVDENN